MHGGFASRMGVRFLEAFAGLLLVGVSNKLIAFYMVGHFFFLCKKVLSFIYFVSLLHNFISSNK